ncbi:transposase, partial [Pseudonocardia lutea]
MARSLPGLASVGAPALVAVVGDASRFPSARHFKSFTGL